MMQMQMQKVLKETCQFEWLTVQTVNTLEQLAEDNANVSKTFFFAEYGMSLVESTCGLDKVCGDFGSIVSDLSNWKQSQSCFYSRFPTVPIGASSKQQQRSPNKRRRLTFEHDDGNRNLIQGSFLMLQNFRQEIRWWEKTIHFSRVY